MNEKDFRTKLLALVKNGYFTSDQLLLEIIVSFSNSEAEQMYDWIADNHDIEGCQCS